MYLSTCRGTYHSTKPNPHSVQWHTTVIPSSPLRRCSSRCVTLFEPHFGHCVIPSQIPTGGSHSSNCRAFRFGGSASVRVHMELERCVRDNDVGGAFVLLESNVYSERMRTKLHALAIALRSDECATLLSCYIDATPHAKVEVCGG